MKAYILPILLLAGILFPVASNAYTVSDECCSAMLAYIECPISKENISNLSESCLRFAKWKHSAESVEKIYREECDNAGLHLGDGQAKNDSLKADTDCAGPITSVKTDSQDSKKEDENQSGDTSKDYWYGD